MNKPNRIALVTQVYKQLLLKKKISSYEVSKQTGIDKTYLSKLAGGKIKKPGQDKLIRIARVLGIELKQLQKVFTDPEIAALELDLGKIDLSQPEIKVNPRQDWGNAPDGLVCYGREAEIATVKQWILENRDRAITIYGLSGIGKTTLAIEVARQLQPEFDYIFWRSLEPSISMEIVINELLKLFQVKISADCSYQERITFLFSRLRTVRCLIIFDNVESILATGNLRQEYQAEFQLYGEFFCQMAESQHQSCLLLVSNQKLREMAIRECASAAVHSLELKGSDVIARRILQDKELPEQERWQDLITAYRGYPLALKIVATTIKEVFNGSVREFLAQNTLFLGDLAFLLDREYARLSDSEKQVISAIAQLPQPVSMVQLSEHFQSQLRNSEIVWSLDVLIWRSLLEMNRIQTPTLYFLHPVIRKYLATK